MKPKRGIHVDVEGGNASDLYIYTAEFATGADEGEYAIRHGKIFEEGEWQDKKFAMTADEMAAAVADFHAPAPIDIEHIETIFDGMLGEVRAIATEDEILMGTVALPKWLDALFADVPIKVSCTWDRATKKLKGLALVKNPRIEDAAIMAAFAEARPAEFAKLSTDHAMHAQRAHDALMNMGAKCSADNVAAMSDGDEGESAMAAHVRTLLGDEGFIAFANAMQAKNQEWTNQSIHDMTIGNGAQCSHFNTSCTADYSGTKKDEDPEKVELRRQLAAMQATLHQSEAVAFAESMLSTNRAVPAERADIIAAYVQAATDDVQYGVASFAGAKVPNRTSLVKALYAARPAHIMTEERIKPDQHQVFYNRDTTADPAKPQPMSEARRAELLGATPLGQAILDEKKSAKK